MLAHDVHEGERVAEVVCVVLDRLDHGLADGLEAGEVDHTVDGVRVKDALEGDAVVDVGAVEGEALGGVLAHDGVDAVEDLLGRVGEVVDDDDLITVLEELDDGVGADEAGAAGDEDAGVLGVFLLAHWVPFGWVGRNGHPLVYVEDAARDFGLGGAFVGRSRAPRPRSRSPRGVHMPYACWNNG